MSRFVQLDETAFERYYGGFEPERSVQLYVKLVNLFLKSFEQKREELIQFLEARDEKQARVIAHRIRGSLLSLGGNALAQAYYDIELGLGTKPEADLLEMLRSKHADTEIFISELNAYVETLEASVKQA